MADPDVLGIDVSHHNGVVRWAAVAAAGIRFAYAKASDGVGRLDPMFTANRAGMGEQGVLRGAYHFFHPGMDPLAQADNFLKVVPAAGPGDLPPMLDLEVDEGQPSDEIVARALAWLTKVEAACHRTPILYTAPGFWNEHVTSGTQQLARFPLWVAHYTTRPAPALPRGFTEFRIWQFTDSGQVLGVDGPVDMDRFHGTLDALQALAAA